MEEKRCLLCNKPYDYKYKMFGRGCLDNIYVILDFHKPPKFVWNKEAYLCTKIAWKNHKYFLTKKKKYDLAQKYIAFNYLEKMNLEALNDVKTRLTNDINNINTFSKSRTELISFTLNDIYKLYNYYQKFEKIIKDFQNIDWEKIDKETAKKLIKSISFIFDITKKSNPISYAVFFSMQYIFWQVVVVGGILCKMKLSAKLLSNALSLFEKEPNDLCIEDNDIIELITENEMFKDKMKQLIQKYGEGKNEFIVDDSAPAEDISITFDSKDLLFALHNATVFVKAQKNEDDIWEMEVQIKDTYDFTEFKNLKEYADNKDGILEDILSTTLNNLAVVSSEYGVIKIYDLEIKFRTKEGKY